MVAWQGDSDVRLSTDADQRASARHGGARFLEQQPQPGADRRARGTVKSPRLRRPVARRLHPNGARSRFFNVVRPSSHSSTPSPRRRQGPHCRSPLPALDGSTIGSLNAMATRRAHSSTNSACPSLRTSPAGQCFFPLISRLLRAHFDHRHHEPRVRRMAHRLRRYANRLTTALLRPASPHSLPNIRRDLATKASAFQNHRSLNPGYPRPPGDVLQPTESYAWLGLRLRHEKVGPACTPERGPIPEADCQAARTPKSGLPSLSRGPRSSGA